MNKLRVCTRRTALNVKKIEKISGKYIMQNSKSNMGDVPEESLDGRGEIIALFMGNIYGKKAPHIVTKHDGIDGHWLEKQLGLTPNSKNAPDINGYEAKKMSDKISFGDWSASAYLFSAPKVKCKYNMIEESLSRDEFIRIFGTSKVEKNNRFSWAGSCFPKYGEWNSCGQRLIFDKECNFVAQYLFSEDTRSNKDSFPAYLKQTGPVTIAFWTVEKLRKKLEKKFNQKGFFICKMDKDGVYNKICFGSPISFDYFKSGLINKTIILDSGMIEGKIADHIRHLEVAMLVGINLLLKSIDEMLT